MWILSGILLLLFHTSSAHADMMQRATEGDWMFTLAFFFLAMLTVLSFIVWLLSRLFKAAPKERRLAGRLTIVLAGLTFLSLISGQIYYHYLGYGAYKKAFIQHAATRSSMENLKQGIYSYAADGSAIPADERTLYALFQNIGIPSRKGRFVDAWDTPIHYKKSGDLVLFRSAGPDQQFFTDDDIVVDAD